MSELLWNISYLFGPHRYDKQYIIIIILNKHTPFTSLLLWEITVYPIRIIMQPLLLSDPTGMLKIFQYNHIKYTHIISIIVIIRNNYIFYENKHATSLHICPYWTVPNDSSIIVLDNQHHHYHILFRNNCIFCKNNHQTSPPVWPYLNFQTCSNKNHIEYTHFFHIMLGYEIFKNIILNISQLWLYFVFRVFYL